ncbi:hypothetical protein ACHAO1_004979 [Botrytis cinerea]
MVRSTKKPAPPANLDKLALNAYPQDNLETAVQKYVIKYWVKWAKFKMNGARYMIAEDILYFRDKGLCITKSELETGDRGRLFWNKMQYPVSLREIDRMTKATESARKVLKHQSEDQWNVPRRSKTHFLNFPRDILDNIFKHALVALPGNVVLPNAMATNWKKRYIEPSHKIYEIGQGFEPYYSDDGHRPWPYSPSYFDNSHASFQRKKLRDKKGSYVELQRILRPQIDATLLRTSKTFREIGSTLLYRQNTFSFGMACESMEKSSPSWIGKWSYRPEPSKRGNDEGSIPKPSSNSKAELSSPQFRAGVTTTRSLQCDDDFIPSIKCYIPFINALCPELHELTLEVDIDHWGALSTPADRQLEFDRLLSKLLEKEARELKTVRVLNVVAAEPPSNHNQKADVSIARDATQWFREREIARVEK